MSEQKNANTLLILSLLSAWICIWFYAPQTVNAQNYTYFGGGVTLHSATTPDDPNIFHITNPYLLDGGGYDVTIRQEINRFLSLETGISAFNYSQDFVYKGEYIDLGGFVSHRVPLKVELEVDVVESRIALYASFGFHLCIPSQVYTGIRTMYLESGTMDMQEFYLSSQWYHSLYNTGIGSRFRIIDELIFELELGYAFRLSELIRYDFSYNGLSGEVSNFSYEETMDYWYLQFGISYPIQRVIQGVKHCWSNELKL